MPARDQNVNAGYRHLSLSGQDQLILAARRNGIVTIRDDIWERGGIKQNCYQSLSLHPQFSFTRLPSNHLETPAPHQNHVLSHILSIGVWKLGREASEARQSKPTDENQSLQMKWTKSFGSTTIRQSDEMNENDPRKIEDHKLPSIFLGSHNASPKPLLRANEMAIWFCLIYIVLLTALRTVVNCIFLD